MIRKGGSIFCSVIDRENGHRCPSYYKNEYI